MDNTIETLFTSVIQSKNVREFYNLLYIVHVHGYTLKLQIPDEMLQHLNISSSIENCQNISKMLKDIGTDLSESQQHILLDQSQYTSACNCMSSATSTSPRASSPRVKRPDFSRYRLSIIH